MTFAAGLAVEGFKPFAAIYSTFLQRAYDQVVHDVAVQSLPVRFAIDRAGLVGADGPTHAGAFDVTYLSCLPGFVVMAASDEVELMHMVATAATIDDRPSAFRYPRGEGTGAALPKRGEVLPIGKGRILREGTTVAILSFGARLAEALQASDQLAGFGLSTTVADARFCQAARRGLGAAACAPPRGAHHPRGRCDRRLRLAGPALSRARGAARSGPQGAHARAAGQLHRARQAASHVREGRPQCLRHRRRGVRGARQGFRAAPRRRASPKG